jgi:hypothetical protein
VPVAITRCGNFYGGGDLNWNRIVPGTIRSMLRGERPVIRSDGQFMRDYFYVEDGAAAYMLLAERLSQARSWRRGLNFSNETQITVLDLVNRILRAMGSKLEPEIRNEAGERNPPSVPERRTRPHRMLNWSPLFTLDEGLDRPSPGTGSSWRDGASRPPVARAILALVGEYCARPSPRLSCPANRPCPFPAKSSTNAEMRCWWIRRSISGSPPAASPSSSKSEFARWFGVREAACW